VKAYYEEAGMTIYHGDCRGELTDFDAAVVTDPPYGINFVKGGGKGKHNRRNLEPVIGDEVSFDASPLLVFDWVLLWGANHFANQLSPGRWLIWDKLDGLKSFDSFSDVEVAWLNKPGADRIFRYLWKGICQAGDKDGGRVHPAQKPVPLMHWCLSFIPEDKLIIDPFMGSGSTLRAAKDLGRKAIGIEIEERYCEIAAKRLAQGVLKLP